MNYSKSLAIAASLFLFASLSLASSSAPPKLSYWENLSGQFLAPSSSTKTCRIPCEAGGNLTEIVQHFEGFSPYEYFDVAGFKTIGFGHKLLPGEKFRQPMSGPEAKALLEKDLRPATRGLNKLLTRKELPQNRFDALLDLVYNTGSGAVKGSHLLAAVNAGKDEEVPPHFLKYDHITVRGKKVKVRGLGVRRKVDSVTYAKR